MTITARFAGRCRNCANEETREFRGRGVPAKKHSTARKAIAHAKMMAGWG